MTPLLIFRLLCACLLLGEVFGYYGYGGYYGYPGYGGYGRRVSSNWDSQPAPVERSPAEGSPAQPNMTPSAGAGGTPGSSHVNSVSKPSGNEMRHQAAPAHSSPAAVGPASEKAAQSNMKPGASPGAGSPSWWSNYLGSLSAAPSSNLGASVAPAYAPHAQAAGQAAPVSQSPAQKHQAAAKGPGQVSQADVSQTGPAATHDAGGDFGSFPASGGAGDAASMDGGGEDAFMDGAGADSDRLLVLTAPSGFQSRYVVRSFNRYQRGKRVFSQTTYIPLDFPPPPPASGEGPAMVSKPEEDSPAMAFMPAKKG
ncbi:transient receptor potential protein-like [Engraulis encrasicolus]|uniref:transient receptor potential protein-like n=1 Tax=Engraulis encrasicolus TaxID=184585 RepID=UPI002FD115E4